MDAAQYRSGRSGRVRIVGRGEAAYTAFVPSPIPRTLEFSGALVSALSRADMALGRLAGVGLLLPNPHLLIQPYLRREAVASTRIEGTQSSLSDVLAAEARRLPETADRQEVLNCVRALELGLHRLDELPLSNRLIREMHRELLRGARGEERTPGEFRTSQNWIGGHSPADALFVPPPVDDLAGALTDFERFLHEGEDTPLLVRCALLHYQFETIHPFLDGNGRLGRLLVIFYLVERKALRQPLLYLSAYLERHREEYVSRLQAVREQGQYEEWVTFFLQAVATQAATATRAAEALIGIGADFRERLRRVRARGHAVDAAESLVGNPYVTVPSLAAELGLTRQGAQHVVATLERAGIVERVPAEGRRPALYLAREVLDVLESDD